MQYNIVLFWNGTRVLDGKASAVVAHDISRAHCVEQFAGSAVKRWEAEAFHVVNAPFGLDKVAQLQRGEILTGSYEDRTGFAQFTIERL